MRGQEIDTNCNVQILEAIENREKRYAATWDNEMNHNPRFNTILLKMFRFELISLILQIVQDKNRLENQELNGCITNK